MPRCHFCNRWMIPGLGGVLPAYRTCLKCTKEWFNKCREHLLAEADAGEVFRAPRVSLAWAFNPNTNQQYEDLEGDLVFLPNNVAFLAYWAREQSQIGGEFTRTMRGMMFGVVGAAVIGWLEAKKQKKGDEVDALSPAEQEIDSKITRLRRGGDADPMMVDLVTAINMFPYVAAIKRADLETIECDIKNKGLRFKTKSASVFFAVKPQPDLQRLVKEASRWKRNVDEILRGFESRIAEYLSSHEV